jgi:hypothetical protein
VTWYITNGAGVTSPSENLGLYISGVHAPGWSETLDDGNLRNLSQRMITVDMSEQLYTKLSSDQVKESTNNDPAFMETVSVYDIAEDQWYAPVPASTYMNLPC